MPAWKSKLLLEPNTKVIISSSLMAWMCLLAFPSFTQLPFLSVWPVNFLRRHRNIWHPIQHTAITSSFPFLRSPGKEQIPNPDFLELWAVSEKTRGQTCSLQESRGIMKGLLSWAALWLHVVTTLQCYNYLIAKVCLKGEVKVCGKVTLIYKSHVNWHSGWKFTWEYASLSSAVPQWLVFAYLCIPGSMLHELEAGEFHFIRNMYKFSFHAATDQLEHSSVALVELDVPEAFFGSVSKCWSCSSLYHLSLFKWDTSYLVCRIWPIALDIHFPLSNEVLFPPTPFREFSTVSGVLLPSWLQSPRALEKPS